MATADSSSEAEAAVAATFPKNRRRLRPLLHSQGENLVSFSGMARCSGCRREGGLSPSMADRYPSGKLMERLRDALLARPKRAK